MTDRRPFNRKYSDLFRHWNLDDATVTGLLRQFDERLRKETDRLKTQPFAIDKYFWDRRTTSEYLYDLIDAWLIEELVANVWLKQRLKEMNVNISLELNGTDKNRLVEKNINENISTEPDLLLKWENRSQPVELQMARRELKNGYDMKETKVKHAQRLHSLFLWIVLPRSEFFIINPIHDLTGILPFENKAWGGKRVYRISQEKIKSLGYYKMSKIFTEDILTKLGMK